MNFYYNYDHLILYKRYTSFLTMLALKCRHYSFYSYHFERCILLRAAYISLSIFVYTLYTHQLSYKQCKYIKVNG